MSNFGKSFWAQALVHRAAAAAAAEQRSAHSSGMRSLGYNSQEFPARIDSPVFSLSLCAEVSERERERERTWRGTEGLSPSPRLRTQLACNPFARPLTHSLSLLIQRRKSAGVSIAIIHTLARERETRSLCASTLVLSISIGTGREQPPRRCRNLCARP